ncbi:hypothetical protein C0993_007281 [Termitomyces sp. T159_Od127]|nr:hypothetical protein C0993_007281 [Termitomyces sp. T159_Od127]
MRIFKRESLLNGLAYRHINLDDFTLDDNLPDSQCQPDDDQLPHPPQASLGALQALPLELLGEILRKLDLQTLTYFRHVNRRAMRLVGSLPQYKAIRKHAYNALRGMMYIKTSQWITCETLYEKLYTKHLPLRYLHAIRKFGLNRRILGTLPSMRSIPGTYSPIQRKVRAQITLVDSDCARRAGIALHGSVSAMEQYVSNISTAAPDPFDGKSGNSFRLMAIVRTPWLDKSSQKLEWGFHCTGCQECYYSRPLHFRRKFTVDSFKEHLRKCGNIRDGKHHLN